MGAKYSAKSDLHIVALLLDEGTCLNIMQSQKNEHWLSSKLEEKRGLGSISVLVFNRELHLYVLK